MMATIVRERLDGPAAWRGEELARATDWIRSFSPAELDELDAALRGVQARGLPWAKITRADFPLPRLSRGLAEVAEALERGRGIVLLRGLPVAGYSDEDLKQLYFGL